MVLALEISRCVASASAFSRPRISSMNHEGCSPYSCHVIFISLQIRAAVAFVERRPPFEAK